MSRRVELLVRVTQRARPRPRVVTKGKVRLVQIDVSLPSGFGGILPTETYYVVDAVLTSPFDGPGGKDRGSRAGGAVQRPVYLRYNDAKRIFYLIKDRGRAEKHRKVPKNQ